MKHILEPDLVGMVPFPPGLSLHGTFDGIAVGYRREFCCHVRVDNPWIHLSERSLAHFHDMLRSLASKRRDSSKPECTRENVRMAHYGNVANTNEATFQCPADSFANSRF